MKRAGQSAGASLARLAGAIQGRLWRPDVLRPHAQSDEPGRNARKPGKMREQTQDEWRPGWARAAQHGPNDPPLDDDLEPLDDTRGELAPSLDPAQVIIRHSPLAQRRHEEIGAGHGIL